MRDVQFPCGIASDGNQPTAGKPEGTLEERWADLGDAAELIAAAPDDEILGEILALQVSSQMSVLDARVALAV